jgi:RecA-family ATPase
MVGDPPPRSWLVEGLLETSKPGILASIGGVGKSMLALDLALKVSSGRGTWLGKPIKKPGNVLVLAAEDDSNEVFRRLKALDPEDKRYDTEYDTYVYTVPDTEKPLMLLKDDKNGLALTPEADELVEELSSFNDISLVIIDPIQSFVAAPITTSQEAAQLYCQFCAGIASKFEASVLSLHHMAKSALAVQEDQMSLRASVRGSSSLIDGHRLCLAVGLCEEQQVKNICAEEGLEYERTRVVTAGVVKANSSEVDTNPMTLIRRNAVLEVYEKKGINWEF